MPTTVPDMKEVAVAVGVILDERQQILIARRPDDKHQGGLWEFPGGKIETGETTPQALVRELAEELGLFGLATQSMQALTEVRFQYPDKAVRLDVWIVQLNASQAAMAHGAEGQPIVWTEVGNMADYAFPQANLPILAAIKSRLLSGN
jgi:8-oxo-dGTP diphosphatase